MKLSPVFKLFLAYHFLFASLSHGANTNKKRKGEIHEAESDDESFVLPEAPFGANRSIWFDMTVPGCFVPTSGANKRQRPLEEGVSELLRLVRDDPIRPDATNPQLLRSFAGTAKEEDAFLAVLEAVLRERAGKGADNWQKYCDSTDNAMIKMLKRYGLSTNDAKDACEQFRDMRSPKARESFDLAEAYFKVLCIKKYSSKGALKELCGKMVDDYTKKKHDYDRNGGNGGPDSFGFSGFSGPGSSLVA